MFAKLYKSAIICIFIVLLITGALSNIGTVQAEPDTQSRAAANQSTSTVVNVGIYVIGFGNFDVSKGTYTFDFYLWLEWNASDSTFDPLAFEFMNGSASTKEKLTDDFDNDTKMRSVWYRIQAALSNEPDFEKYPFDKQSLVIAIEDSKLNSDILVYSPYVSDSGLDSAITVSGWQIKDWKMGVTEKSYPWGEKYSRLIFTVKIGRVATTTAIKTLLPPIIFCIISGLSFFFRPDKVANRIGFGTSMLISAVMFHISQTSSLPPLPTLMTIDKIMIATYAFLAASLFVTTIIYIDEEFWKDKDYTKVTNKYGAIITIILPFIVYGLLII